MVVAEVPIPFSEIFVDPFVVGALFVKRLEDVEVEVKELVVEFVSAKKLKGDEGFVDVFAWNPLNVPNALFVGP